MTEPAALVNPGALAVTATLSLPSVSAFCGAEVAKVTEVWPAGMLTVAGTFSRAGFAGESDTVSAEDSVPEMVMVPLPVPPSTSGLASAMPSAVVSLSCTAMAAVPSVQPATCAVRVAFCVPSILLSSITVMVKFAVVCPAGRITVAGTCTAVVSLDVSMMEIGALGATLAVTLPCTVPAFSIAVAGALTASVAVSLSVIAMTALAPE